MPPRIGVVYAKFFATRPKNSRLEKMALRLAGLPPMPHWKDALAAFMAAEFPL